MSKLFNDSSVTPGTPAAGDLIIFFDAITGKAKKITFADYQALSGWAGGGGGGGLIALSTPSPLTTTVISSTAIDLAWTNVANETGYIVQRSLNGTTWTTIATLGAGVTTYSDTGLTASTLYYYRVKATADEVTYTASSYTTDSDTTSAGGPSYLHRSLFTGTNGTNLTAYTPDNGAAWVAFTDVWEIQSNRAIPKIPFAANNPLYLADTGATQDYTITGVCKLLGNNPATQIQIFGRCDGALSKGVALGIKDTEVRLIDIAGASYALGLTTISSLGTTDHTFELIFSGNTAAVKVDGVTVIAATAINAGNNGTKIGIGQAGGVSVVDSSIDSIQSI